jgi:hypothetical protein
MNQQNPLGIPMIDWPEWIKQGVDHIAMVVHKEQERKKK